MVKEKKIEKKFAIFLLKLYQWKNARKCINEEENPQLYKTVTVNRSVEVHTLNWPKLHKNMNIDCIHNSIFINMTGSFVWLIFNWPDYLHAGFVWSALSGCRLISFHWFRLKFVGNTSYVDNDPSPLALCLYRSGTIVPAQVDTPNNQTSYHF